MFLLATQEAVKTLEAESIERLVEYADAEGLPRQGLKTKEELVMRLAKTQFSLKEMSA